MKWFLFYSAELEKLNQLGSEISVTKVKQVASEFAIPSVKTTTQMELRCQILLKILIKDLYRVIMILKERCR